MRTVRLVVLGLAACGGGDAANSCIPGQSSACACSDGRQGAQICADDGTFGACSCDGSADASPGGDGPPGSTDAPRFDAAACDEQGCVANTDPFTGGVYLQGTTSEGLCGTDALQRFWPTLSPDYDAGFDCYADWYAYRPTDQRIFYAATFSGIHEDAPSGADPIVPTEPCDDYVAYPFGFDGAGTLHYRCGDKLYRGAAEMVAFPIQNYIATLADGRSIVVKAALDTPGSDYVVVDASGAELSRVSPHAELGGTLAVAPGAATVAGNKAYVLFLRTDEPTREVVAYRLTESNEWQRMRRLEVDTFGQTSLVISDGTVFIRDPDPLTTFDERIRAFLPDGSEATAWREADATTVRAHIGQQMLVGAP